MTLRARQRNNTIAGMFVLLSIIGFVAVVIVLSDMNLFERTQQVAIRFDPATGAPGLDRGSAVTLAGVTIGKVKSVSLNLGGPAPDDDHVLVEILIPAEFTVRADAQAGLVVPIIGSEASINLEGLGSGRPLGADDVLIGEFAPSMFLRSAGLGPEQMEEIRVIVNRLAVISADVAEVTTFTRERIDRDGEEIVRNIRQASASFREVAQSLRERWSEWASTADRAFVNLENATAEAENLLTDGRELVASIDEGVAGVRSTFDDLSPRITTSVENIEALTTKAREDWMSEVDSFIARTNETMDRSVSIMTNLDETLTTDLPEVSRILANMRIASNNLKLAMVEIRNEPWRLLAAPSERAVQEALMYDAVRTYANAVSDLDASIMSLQALRDRYGDDFDPESDAVQRVLAEIEGNLEQYKSAEKLWYDLLLEQANAGN